MTEDARKSLIRMFRRLAVKSALACKGDGEITELELNKLDRVQALLRKKPTPEEVSAREKFRWEYKNWFKEIGRLRVLLRNP